MRSSPLRAAGILVLLASVCVAPFTASAQGVQAASAGAALFGSRCTACHSLDANRVGPMLRGVVGRKVASAPAYEYSDALKRVRGRWDAHRLEAWLRNPQSVAPGTRMAFSLASATDRDAVIEYLASTSLASGAVKP
jgi:cytochrome c